jgi:sulfoxide reductase catalytic subunit YedY
MLIRRPARWALPEREATSESVFLSRRQLLGGSAGLIAASVAMPAVARARPDEAPDIAAELYPAKRNDAYELDRPLTEKRYALTYNNFYEFGSHKEIWRRAQDLKVRPWTVKIDGMVSNPMELDVEDLIRKLPIEERLYRHRCVEAWSMTVPWSGFALKELVKLAAPQAGAKYLRMETFMDPKTARGQRQRWYPWPYVEGLRLDEATNDLAFVATGVYGKPIVKQMGAPLRLAAPWKYGFKSIKSLVRFTFTDEQPKSFWEVLLGREYGFYANVNPKVDHPRWSQATERVLGTDTKVPTLLYNGYAEEVAGMYANMDQTKIFY